MRDWQKYLLLGTGVAAAALGIGVAASWYSRRPIAGARGRKGLAGRGETVTHVARRPRMAFQQTIGDMTLAHYRQAFLPIDQRVRLIQDRVWKGVHDPRMRKLALQLTYSCPARDGDCEARSIYDAVKGRVRYTGDVAPIKFPDGSVEAIDYYQSPWRTWEFKGGDCDDHNALVATLLALNQIEPRLRVTRVRGQDWGHIYVVAGLPKLSPKRWIAADTTLPNSRFADEAPYARHLDFLIKTAGVSFDKPVDVPA